MYYIFAGFFVAWIKVPKNTTARMIPTGYATAVENPRHSSAEEISHGYGTHKGCRYSRDPVILFLTKQIHACRP